MAAPTITSFTPTSVSTKGGDTVTLTGTNFASVNAATVNGKAAQLLSDGRSATNLAIRVPANAAGDYKIVLTDETDVALVESATSLTYAVPDTGATRGSSTSAASYALLVSGDGGVTFTRVKGMTAFTPTTAATKQDDTDFDDVDENGLSWQSQRVTQLAWSNTGTVRQARYAGNPDPGQEIIRLAAEQGGDDAVIPVQWYDLTGGPEAYEGQASCEFTPKGGGTADLKMADFTLTGNGPRVPMTNPAAS